MGCLPCRGLLVLLCLSYCHSSELYKDMPKLMTENGHLFIMTASDKNITLRTSGNGYVNLNSDNLVNVAHMARRAADAVTRFQQNVETSIQRRLDSLTNQISGRGGLSYKMTMLEQAVLNGNISSGSTSSLVSSPGRSNYGMRLNRLGSRLRSVELQVRNIRSLLTIDECLSNPCRNGGTCQDLFNGFICICPTNWQGTLCDEDVNECLMFAGTESGCKNGATCINKPGTYECLCKDTYFGLHCTLRTNDCSNENSARLCGNGICVNHGGNGRGFVCICNEGWTTDLSHSCTVDVDECQAKHYPCSHDPYVQCINLPGSYHCGFCPPGFSGNGFQCSDTNECESNNGGCSLVPKVSCINTRGSRVCGHCPPGYTGDGVTCTPVAGGICAINNGGCYLTAQCFENAGIVTCRCPDGFAGSGYGPAGCSPSALSTHHCQSNPCKNGGTCILQGTKPICVCPPPLTGPDCSTVFDPCMLNPCQNQGTCTVQWVQGVSQARCTCLPGFEGHHCEQVSSDCGGMFYQDSGELIVPTENAVQVYNGGKRCRWRIEVSSVKVVQITFKEIIIENCEKARLEIHDPSADGSWTSYCKTFTEEDLPSPVTSLTNVIVVEFFVSSGINQNRFKLSWKAIEPSCGGEITAQYHGTIKSPGFPDNYSPNQDCEWRIIAQPGKRIQLLFNTLDIEASSDCSKDYLKIQELEGSNPGNLLAQFCNTSTPAPVTTHFPAAYLFFHSDGSGSRRGFKLMYTLIDSCGGVLTSHSGDISPPMDSNQQYEDEQDCEWRIQLPLGSRIKISFNTFDLEDREVCDDFLEVRDGPDSSSPLVGQWCGSTLPPPYSSSANTLTVIFHSDFVISGSGFTLHYETLCGGEFTSPTGEIWSPNYPQKYPAERECIFTISTAPSTAILLQFQDFDLEGLGESCPYDSLEIHDGDNINSTIVGRYCGSKKPPDTISTFNYMYIVFSSDSSHQFRGFLANYSTIDLPCGGILKQTTGTFSSPQTEEGYPPNTVCKWLISAPPGWIIRLSWLSMHLEHSRTCQMDAVEVYENNTVTGNGMLIDKYCGHRLPPSTTTNSNMVTIHFYSDDSVHRDGFTAHYIMLDRRKYCGGTFRSISGTLESPNFPEDYPDNKECTWIIHVAQGQKIKLHFDVFHLEGNIASCGYDSLEIRNGLLATSPVIGTFCGEELPPDVVSFTNALRLHFSSDRSNRFTGFRAFWDATATGCGGTLTGPRGSITSPNYPLPYANDADCFFKISISQGSQVRLTIVDMDLESHSHCAMDYVEVFDGLNDNSKSLGRFCNNNHPPSILASKNHMFIKFVSDISYSGRGFQVNYNTECNVTLKGYHGVLESPNYPGKYLPSMNCMWKIQAPLGNKINITFVHFSLEESARPYEVRPGMKHIDCRYDSLEISEGTKDDAPSNVMGRYCGDELPLDINSQFEQVYIHFVTDSLFEKTGFHLEWAVSGCGGMYREKPVGTFTSPNYPNGYPEEVECEWLFIAPWDKSIEITVNTLHLEDLSGCDFDYLAIYGGEDDTAPLLSKSCHDLTSPLISTTSGNKAFVRFRSDVSMSGKGFSASWKFVDSRCGGKLTSPFGSFHSHNYPKNYDNNDDCEWLIQVLPNHLINLTFTDFDVEPSANNITTDYVNVYDGSSVNDPLVLSHSGNMLPNPPSIISTNNTLLIRHKADGSLTAKGFSADYVIACGARINARGSGSLSMDGTMSASSPWISEHVENCTWYIIAEDPADRITLTFTFLDVSPNTENNNTACSYNYVAVHDGNDINGTTLALVCGTMLPLPVHSSGGALTVNAISVSNSRGHLGRFSALYSTYSTACGGELISEQGAIASPNYPEGYPAGADCVWELKASVGNKVALYFIKFDLEPSDYCNGDYVEVRTGSSNGTLHGIFCDTAIPTNITAENSLWVRFHSDALNTARGFMAEYSLIHGNYLVGDAGQIASPLYPRYFVQSGNFKWTVSVSNRKVVKITFSEFYMDRYSVEYEDCYVFLQIFDGPEEDGSSPSLLKTCGAALPNPVVSTGNIVTIIFSSSPYVHGSLFLLNWEGINQDSGFMETNTTIEESLGCGARVHVGTVGSNNTAIISSPGFPKQYGSDLQCTWILDTSPGYHLVLKFINFDLEEFDECDTDYVQVSTEPSIGPVDWNLLTPKLCLPNTTSMVLVGTNRMKIYFETDSSEEKSGFSASVIAVCGGRLTDPSGKIDTTHLSANSSTGRVNCEWELSVRSGRTIQFTFEEINLPKLGLEACVNSYIMFHNGGYKDSPPLGNGKYCGNTVPLVPKSSSNRVFISYYAMASAPGVILRYEEVSFACSNDITLSASLPNVTISSPDYPQSPSTPHITCTWTVTAPPGESVQLDFINRFDLKPSRDCALEYVEVRDGGTDISPLIGQYCSTTPSSKVSLGNRMFIKYFTDSDAPNNGFSAIVKIATCGGTYYDQKKVVLTSPQYPGRYPKNLDCLWRIVGFSVDYQLTFNVTELLLDDEESCSNAMDYIEIINFDPISKNMSDTPAPTKLCGRLNSEFNGSALVPPSISNEVYIRFRSGSQNSYSFKRRFSITITAERLKCSQEINAPSGIIMTPGYPNPAPRLTYFYCTWLITVPEGRRVTLTMLDYDLEPSKESYWTRYKLSFYSGTNYMTTASSQANLVGRPIDAYSNQMRIHYYEESISGAHRGFKAEFSSDKTLVCGGKLGNNGSVSFSALEKNMTYYWCDWTYTRDPLASNQSTFTLSINGTLNANSSGLCSLSSTEDSITIRNVDSSARFGGRLLARICENTNEPIVVRIPFPSVTINAKKRGAFPLKNKEYPPSIANFSIAFKTDPCGGIINGPNATITSPGFPRQYPANIDCAWVVKFQPDSKIHVKFESLDLDADCNKAFLRLYNGETPLQPHLTGPLCGNNIPGEIITQRNIMFIEFHSGLSTQISGQHNGFKITLTTDVTGCGGILHSARGELMSPNYGTGDYPNNIECEWTVNLSPGFYAGISFLGRFSLENSNGCVNDFIQISEWRNAKWEQIGENICGRTPPSDIKTAGNLFKVLFRTNSSVTSDGFQLSWTSLCGGVIPVVGEGIIISPNYPKPYPSNSKCNYTLLAPRRSIYGKFEDFSIEEGLQADGSRCRFDNVSLTFYPVATMASSFQSLLPPGMNTFNRFRVMGRNKMTLCGSQIPEPVVSKDILELVFSSDSYISLKGFFFKYSLLTCGGNITSPTVISSPNNTHFENCIWLITAPSDRVVVIKIQKLHSFFRWCINEGLQLYNGHNTTDSSSLIDTICYNANSNKTRYVSSGNTMAIKYYSRSSIPLIFQVAIGFTYGEKQKCGGTIHTADTHLPYILQAPDVDGDNKYETLLNCGWLFLAPDAHRIHVTVNKIDIQNCSSSSINCSCDFLEIYNGDSEADTLIDRYCGTHLNQNPFDLVSTSGSLFVLFSSDAAIQLSGFQLSITTFLSPCGLSVRNATRDIQVLQSPGYPSYYTEQDCLWTIISPRGSGLLSLQFTDLDLPDPCSHNYLKIKETTTFSSFIDRILFMDRGHPGSSTKICGNRTTQMTVTSRKVEVHFLANRVSSHRGFRLEYKLKGCNENYTAPYGRIINNQMFDSGLGPCNILIQIPQPNATISLYFTNFVCFERGQSNPPDKIIVYDGLSDAAEEILSFCAPRNPSPVFSSGPALYIKFSSFSRLGRHDITYTSTDKGRGCGGTFNDLSGGLSSPLYPSTYKKDSSCRWDISVPHGNRVFFNFIYFDIGQTFTCSSNYIQFYDVDTSTGTESLHARYCGQDMPAQIEMNGHTAYVRYVTTIHNNGTGWVLRWSASPDSA